MRRYGFRLSRGRGARRAARTPALVAVLATVLAMGGWQAAASAKASGLATVAAHAPRPLSVAGLARLERQVDHTFLPNGVPGLTGASSAATGSSSASGNAGANGAAAARLGMGCRTARAHFSAVLPGQGAYSCAVTRTTAGAAKAGTAAGASAGWPGRAGSGASGPSVAASMQEPDLQNVLNQGANVAVLPMPGQPGAVVRFEGNGDVALVSPTGMTAWDRDPLSFLPDWHVVLPPPRSNGFTPRFNPFILAGPSPMVPSLDAATPYAVGFVPGEQDPVVAVAHVADGYDMPPGDLALPNSFVTVLDGRTGATLWHRQYPGWIMQLGFADGHLVVGDTAGPSSEFTNGFWGLAPGGPAGTVSSLDDWAFSASAGGLSGSLAWSYTMHSPNALWLGLTQAGPRKLAAAWTDTPLDEPGVPGGHVVLLSARSGQVKWDAATAGFPRALAFDAVRGQVVVEEQADPTLQLRYALTGLRIANGATAGQIVRDNAMPFQTLQVGDVTGAGAANWVVTEQPFVPCPPPFQDFTCLGNSQVVAFTPGSQSPAWVSQLPAGGPAFFGGPKEAYGLLLARTGAGPEVIVASQQLGASPSPQTPLGDFTQDLFLGPYSDLRALAGSDGHLLWSRSGGDEVGPPSIVATTLGGQPAVASINEEQDLHIFAAADGTPLASAAMFAGGMFTAASADVSGDGAGDLIVGGESGGVFAIDGSQPGDTPHILWHTSLGAPIHRISVVQLGKTGPPSLVVAATDKLAVLSLDGSIRYQVPFPPGEFVWTFAAGDLGSGSMGIVVPTNALTALDGSTGGQLWRYQPDGGNALFSNPVISAHGTVVAESAVPPANFGPPGEATDQTAVGINGTTGGISWQATAASPAGTFTLPVLDGGVVAGPDVPGGGGSAAALAWYQGSTDFLGNSEIDVRNADTGALQYSQILPNFAVSGLATGPAFGLAACMTTTNGGVEPAIADIQPSGITYQQPDTDGCSAATPTASSFLVAQPLPLELLAAPGDYPAAGGTITQVYDPHDIGITSAAAATFGAGTGDAVGLAYDWEVEQDLGIPMNDFGFLGTSATDPTGIPVYSLP
jgi:hypothetical protein